MKFLDQFGNSKKDVIFNTIFELQGRDLYFHFESLFEKFGWERYEMNKTETYYESLLEKSSHQIFYFNNFSKCCFIYRCKPFIIYENQFYIDGKKMNLQDFFAALLNLMRLS